jgi:hypothetical protein
MALAAPIAAATLPVSVMVVAPCRVAHPQSPSDAPRVDCRSSAHSISDVPFAGDESLGTRFVQPAEAGVERPRIVEVSF